MSSALAKLKNKLLGIVLLAVNDFLVSLKYNGYRIDKQVRWNMKEFSIGGVIYIIIGVIIASNQGYLASIGSLADIVSAALAVSLWPLLFLGINLHVVF